jgi:hypothetical protein
MEIEAGEYGTAEIFGIDYLLGGATFAAGVELALVGRISSFNQQFGFECFDTVGRGPNAALETLPSLHLDHGPDRAALFDPAAERSVAWRQQTPTDRHSQNVSAGIQHVAWFGERTDFEGFNRHAAMQNGRRRSSSSHKAKFLRRITTNYR